MEELQIIDMDLPEDRFITSFLCQVLCKFRLTLLIQAWNAHTIPGKGVPNQLGVPQGTIPRPPEDMLLPVEEAVKIYTSKYKNSALTEPFEFGFLTEQQKLFFENALLGINEAAFREIFSDIQSNNDFS